MFTFLFPTITHYTCIQLHNEENGTLATHQFCSYCLSFFYYPPSCVCARMHVCVHTCVCFCATSSMQFDHLCGFVHLSSHSIHLTVQQHRFLLPAFMYPHPPLSCITLLSLLVSGHFFWLAGNISFYMYATICQSIQSIHLFNRHVKCFLVGNFSVLRIKPRALGITTHAWITEL